MAGYGLTDVYTKTQVDQSLALKAPLASPALTGVPTAPTPAAGTNTTQLATSAFVQSAIAALVASSPGALDTLNELAAALGNDPNFATTVFKQMALKAPLASPVFTGEPKAPTMARGDITTKLATTEFVQSSLGNMAGAPVPVSADTILAPAQAGLLFITGSGNQFTLPSLASVPDGACYHFLFNYDGGSVKASNGSVIQAGGAPTTVYSAGYGERLTLVKRSNAWYAAGGGVGIDGFISSRGITGWEKRPGGVIEQWGTINCPTGVSTANIDIVFPIRFPGGCLGAVATIGIWAADFDIFPVHRICRQEVSVGSVTAAGVDAQAFMDNNINSQRVVYWRAHGY
ncbi:hypothetical protein D3C77_428110 [compost metagenome]